MNKYYKTNWDTYLEFVESKTNPNERNEFHCELLRNRLYGPLLIQGEIDEVGFIDTTHGYRIQAKHVTEATPEDRMRALLLD